MSSFIQKCNLLLKKSISPSIAKYAALFQINCKNYALKKSDKVTVAGIWHWSWRHLNYSWRSIDIWLRVYGGFIIFFKGEFSPLWPLKLPFCPLDGRLRHYVKLNVNYVNLTNHQRKFMSHAVCLREIQWFLDFMCLH